MYYYIYPTYVIERVAALSTHATRNACPAPSLPFSRSVCGIKCIQARFLRARAPLSSLATPVSHAVLCRARRDTPTYIAPIVTIFSIFKSVCGTLSTRTPHTQIHTYCEEFTVHYFMLCLRTFHVPLQRERESLDTEGQLEKFPSNATPHSAAQVCASRSWSTDRRDSCRAQ